MTTTLLAAVLATNNFGDTRDDNGLAGPIGLLIILVLAGATIFLIRNMNARLRRLPDRFPSSPPVERRGTEAGQEPSGPTAQSRQGRNAG